MLDLLYISGTGNARDFKFSVQRTIILATMAFTSNTYYFGGLASLISLTNENVDRITVKLRVVDTE